MGAARLIGRAEEQSILTAALRARGSVVLAGGAGVGKTALARDVAAALDASEVVWASATRSSMALPLAALAPLLIDFDLGDVVRSSDDVLGLTSAVRRHVAGRAALLVVDDAHLLDDVSATVVHQLVAGDVLPALLVVTSGRPAPDAITALWKDGWARRVDLVALSQAETETLVEELTGTPCDRLVHRAIWDTSEGNPLFVSELVRAALANGALRLVGDELGLVGELDIGQRLVELVGARVAELTPAARRAAEIVAIAEPVTLDLVEHIVEDTALAEAEERGVIVVANVGDRSIARVTHPTYGEVLRSRTPTARRRTIARLLADALEARGLHTHDELLRFASWRLDAGAPPEADVLVDAAWFAAERLDAPLAERYARAATTAPGRSTGVHAAHLVLADAQYRQGRHDDALLTLTGDPGDDDRARTEDAVLRSKILVTIGRADDAMTVLDEAFATVADPGCVTWLDAFRATVLVTSGELGSAIAVAEPIVHEGVDARAKLTATSALAMAYAFAGRREAALAAVAAGQDPRLREGTHLRTLLSWASPAVWVAHWAVGDLDACDAAAAAFRELGVQTRNGDRAIAGAIALAAASVRRGDATRARALLDEEHLGRRGRGALPAATLGVAGIDTLAVAVQLQLAALAMDGEVDGRAAADRSRGTNADAPRWFDGWAELAHAWARYAAGETGAATAELRDVASDARRRGDGPVELEALYALARLADARVPMDRIADVAGTIDGEYVIEVVAHCNGLAARDAHSLDAASRRLDAMGHRVVAAEAAAAAAMLHESAGSLADAEASRAAARAILARCPGTRSPVVSELRLRAALSARELEIARLAARGRSTKAIAAELVVSVRTVDSHLAHVYTKLGIAGRHELPAALG